MGRQILMAIAGWLICLCVLSCISFQHGSPALPLQTGEKQTAEALLSIGNDYYNRASAPGLPAEGKNNLYKQALASYRQALQAPCIEDKMRAELERYVKETEELLVHNIYSAGASLVPVDANLEVKKENAPKAIPHFKEVIEKYPNTDYADLSHVQLGLCYEYLERWEDAEKAYDELIKKYTDENGNPITPYSDNVIQALEFAKQRKIKIIEIRLHPMLLISFNVKSFQFV